MSVSWAAGDGLEKNPVRAKYPFWSSFFPCWWGPSKNHNSVHQRPLSAASTKLPYKICCLSRLVGVGKYLFKNNNNKFHRTGEHFSALTSDKSHSWSQGKGADLKYIGVSQSKGFHTSSSFEWENDLAEGGRLSKTMYCAWIRP